MQRVSKALKYLFLIIVSFISIFPFIWMLLGATNTTNDITKGKLMVGTHLIENIRSLIENVQIGQILLNTLFIAIISTLSALVICSLAGYGFEIFRTRKLDKVFSFLLLSMMIPITTLMIPLFIMFSKMGALNSLWAVILPNSATAFLIFFFRQNTKSFSREIIQAARVDGLSEIQIFFRIYMPIMKSTYAAAAIITFMNNWNNYMWPLIVLQTPDKLTLPLMISSLSSSYHPDYGMIMVAIMISTIPMAVVFFLMQKRFVQGMIGAVK